MSKLVNGHLNIQSNLTAGQPVSMPYLTGQAGTSAMAPSSLGPGRRDIRVKVSFFLFFCRKILVTFLLVIAKYTKRSKLRKGISFGLQFKEIQSLMVGGHDGKRVWRLITVSTSRKQDEEKADASLAFSFPLRVEYRTSAHRMELPAFQSGSSILIYGKIHTRR